MSLKMKTYILQKDIRSPLLNIDAGAEFIQSSSANHIGDGYTFGHTFLQGDKVENNPEWFKLKEGKPKAVTSLWDKNGNGVIFTIKYPEGNNSSMEIATFIKSGLISFINNGTFKLV